MKVLVVGGGGREHALAWKLSRERSVADVSVRARQRRESPPSRASFPSNPTTSRLWSRLAEHEAVDLTVVGPELPLNAGIADAFSAHGLRLFGPSRAAAQLECSKVFAKDFMARHGIPTARYRVCTSAAEARAVVASGELGLPVVIKADGLAAGKGVVVAQRRARSGGGDPRGDGRAPVRRRRLSRRHRRMHGWSRSIVLCALRRKARHAAGFGAGP